MSKSLLALLAVCVILSGGSALHNSVPAAPSAPDPAAGACVPGGEEAALPDCLLNSYYLSAQDPVYSYLQNKSIKRFLDMWFEYFIDGSAAVTWNYDTLAPVQLLDHSFQSLAGPDVRLYTCTFTTGDGRCGYIIISYQPQGPAISKWSLNETTPHLYDLRANSAQIADALAQTDIDLSTATATRVEWMDTDKNRGDRVILFTDKNGGRYLCFLGEEELTVEKQ